MLIKILKKDFSRQKKITIVLFIFVLLSAVLVASGSNMIMELTNSLNYLFIKSDAPHFVQMHAGEIDQAAIDRWTAPNSLVERQQTVEMINIDGSNISIGNSETTEKSSVMDISFVKQNHLFDFLLDLENQVIQVSRGEIAVPIYYMQEKDLKIGDKVRISDQTFDMEFTVVDFVRDAQMNPSVVSSKRFVVSEADFETLKKNTGEREYLIEFQLTDLSQLSEFSTAYQSTSLPKTGPAVDCNLFKTLNALTDGIVAALIILVSLLINIVALLCLAFTIHSTIEEDYREIGVMKAIGIQQQDIKKIYLAKYVVMAALASVLGYVASLFLNQLFTANIMLYIGAAPKSILQYLVPIIAVGLIFLIVVSFCTLVLRRFNKITAVEALRSGNMGEIHMNKRFLPLHKSNFFNVNVFLGIRDVTQRFKMYRLLFFVFFVCTFIIIIPINFLNTFQSPSFVTYMGIGQSDIRIDLRQSADVAKRFDEMITYIQNDQDVERFSPLVTSQFKVINSEGLRENLSVETGDFTVFPLEYLSGGAPTGDNEIALSYLNSQGLNKRVGDTLQLVVDGREQQMVVSGTYQDVTNGGLTAKATVPFNKETVLWYVVAVDVKAEINPKIDEYNKVFYPAKVTHLQGYVAQTFGNTIEQLKLITAVAIVIAISVSILITSLFLKMLIAKDYSQIAIMKSLGASLQDSRLQYVTRALVVLNIGIIIGTIISNTFGQNLVSAVMSQMGASNIEFVIKPIQAYVLSPLALMIVVTVTTLISITSIKETSIAKMILE
ncbi:MAG TPA: FtsX-like permease family protein [Anaerolineales bacterium]|nr:FtsX-like permease family protein [Anaerolineales bacterium]